VSFRFIESFAFSIGATELYDELAVFVSMKFLICPPWWLVVE
jgi:hypothetical protein